MQADDVYALTSAGEAELRGGCTQLGPQEIDVLVRVDGQLTLDDILRKVPQSSHGAFMAAFRSLVDRRLLALWQPDAFTLQWQTALEGLSAAGDDARADAGLASLQRDGFYVQIARERARARPRQGGKRLSALVVEDDPMLARFTGSLLALSGFDVRQAGGRQEVVSQLRKLPIPDLILLDVQLPDVDGFDVLCSVRAHPAFRDVAVIMLTGMATRESVLKGLAAGADGYITKPAEPHALLRAVRAVLALDGEDAPADPWEASR